MLLAAWYHTIFGVLFAFLCLLLIGVILLQRGRGGGLSGAFGGVGGAASTAFGSKTGDILTWITVAMAVVFLLFAVGLNYMFRPPAAPKTPVVPTAAQTPTSQPTSSTPAIPAPASSTPTTPAPASSTPATPAPDSTTADTPTTETPAADTPAEETTESTESTTSDEGARLMPELPPIAALTIFGADAI